MKLVFQKIASPFLILSIILLQVGFSYSQTLNEDIVLQNLASFEEITNSSTTIGETDNSITTVSNVTQQAGTEDKPRSNTFVNLMSPQSYSTIGFILFIISIIYIGVIVICIIRRLFKSRAAPRVDDQAALLVPEERPQEDAAVNVASVRDSQYVAFHDPEADVGRNQGNN